MYASGIHVTGLVPCLVNAVDFLLYKYTGQSNALKSILIGISWKAVGLGELLFKMYRASWLDKNTIMHN